MREKKKSRRLEMTECQAITLFLKLPAIKVGYQVHSRAKPKQTNAVLGHSEHGAKEETQRDISKFKNQMTRDKGKEAGLRKHINSI